MLSAASAKSTQVALTIAGSDPSGGAGIQADLKTFHQHRTYGLSVLTLLTVQNTRSVDRVELLSPDLVSAQLDAVLSDIPPAAAKTGALGTAAIVEVVSRHAASFNFPLVVDPVCVSKHGARLLDPEAITALRKHLLPRAYLVTPNLPEAALLAELEVVDRDSMIEAARRIAATGATNVLIKGGHLRGEPVDILYAEGTVEEFHAQRVESRNTHGSGCVLSAAITARLARGEWLHSAIRGAKAFITAAIRTAPQLGSGCGPLDLFASIDGS